MIAPDLYTTNIDYGRRPPGRCSHAFILAGQPARHLHVQVHPFQLPFRLVGLNSDLAARLNRCNPGFSLARVPARRAASGGCLKNKKCDDDLGDSGSCGVYDAYLLEAIPQTGLGSPSIPLNSLPASLPFHDQGSPKKNFPRQ